VASCAGGRACERTGAVPGPPLTRQPHRRRSRRGRRVAVGVEREVALAPSYSSSCPSAEYFVALPDLHGRASQTPSNVSWSPSSAASNADSTEPPFRRPVCQSADPGYWSVCGRRRHPGSDQCNHGGDLGRANADSAHSHLFIRTRKEFACSRQRSFSSTALGRRSHVRFKPGASDERQQTSGWHLPLPSGCAVA
jgi:hypothetical protein